MLADAAADSRQSLPKVFRLGSHRLRDPAHTLEHVRRMLPAMGITRIARLTGLDDLGIPVCAAIRPGSLSVSVSQGKGITDAAAAASAVMEAIEVFHGESLDGRARLASRADLEANREIAFVQGLNRTPKPMPAHMPIRWLEAALLDTGQQAWVPFELVSTDYRVPRSPDAGLFAASTNGLASGNHHVEAAIAAICEVIERDAIALFAARGPGARASRLVDPATVDDPNCRSLLDLIERARMRVQVWDITSDIGIAAFQCRLSDGARDEAVRLGAFRGHGCHPDRRIALSRALTEAAQARLTRIAGARDDLQPRDFGPVEAQAVWDALAELRPAEGAMRRFADVPSFESDDLGDDLSWLQHRLAAAGFVRIALVDLTRPEFGIPVVRVIVPGLEAPDDHPDYVPGARATAARAAGV